MNKRIERKIDRNFYFMVILMGMAFNFMALAANDYRMPIKYDGYINTNLYFSFQDKNDVNLYRFVDIFNLFDYVVFSLGDILIVMGIIGFMYQTIMVYIEGRKNGSNNKNKSRKRI